MTWHSVKCILSGWGTLMAFQLLAGHITKFCHLGGLRVVYNLLSIFLQFKSYSWLQRPAAVEWDHTRAIKCRAWKAYCNLIFQIQINTFFKIMRELEACDVCCKLVLSLVDWGTNWRYSKQSMQIITICSFYLFLQNAWIAFSFEMKFKDIPVLNLYSNKIGC